MYIPVTVLSVDTFKTRAGSIGARGFVELSTSDSKTVFKVFLPPSASVGDVVFLTLYSSPEGFPQFKKSATLKQ